MALAGAQLLRYVSCSTLAAPRFVQYSSCPAFHTHTAHSHVTGYNLAPYHALLLHYHRFEACLRASRAFYLVGGCS